MALEPDLEVPREEGVLPRPHRKNLGPREGVPSRASPAPVVPPPSDRAPIPNVSSGFVNDSEREFAGILDFYQITWEYEPRSFPVVWGPDGEPTSYFSPDFYLPDLDLFIELTTLKQSLVTKKNRKLRLLRELYPDVNIKLLYARDFHSLMRKYGLSQHSNGEIRSGAADRDEASV